MRLMGRTTFRVPTSAAPSITATSTKKSQIARRASSPCRCGIGGSELEVDERARLVGRKQQYHADRRPRESQPTDIGCALERILFAARFQHEVQQEQRHRSEREKSERCEILASPGNH